MSILINGTELGNSIALNNTDLSEIIFNGVTVWRSSNLPVWDNRGLDYNSWETIQSYILNGMFSTVASVGDTKSFVMNGKTYHAEVVSINNGTGNASIWYPANTVDFICTELYETAYRYNSSDINAGGFPSSEIKNTLKNTIYPLLPSDLKAVIVDKSHSYQSGSYSGDSWNSQMTTLATKLWLPTYYEIAGATHQYAPGETSSNNKAYTLSSTIKMLNGSSSAPGWWMGSPRTNNSSYFFMVNSGGGIASFYYASDVRGIPICFRIGVPPKSFENTSWQEIKNDIANGTFSQYASVGDTKSFVINGHTYNAEVVAINDGTGSAGSWYPNKTVDFICKELCTVSGYNEYDAFEGDNAGGFPNSDVKDYLENEIYPLLPSDLKNVIINKSHSYQSGSYSYVNYSWSSQMTTLATKLWLPTHYEIAGAVDEYAPGETASNNKAYTLASRIKGRSNGSADNWWLGTPYTYEMGSFWMVTEDGSLEPMVSYYNEGVPICFRIG